MRTGGSWGEDAAAARARAGGAVLLARNYRGTAGEIDLVLRHRDALAFAEVKARGWGGVEEALAAVTPRKQARIARAALDFLAQYGLDLEEVPLRFDVFAVWPDARGAPEVAWIEDAFAPPLPR